MWAAVRIAVTWVFGDDVVKAVLYVVVGVIVFAYSATCSALRSIESQPMGQWWLYGAPHGVPAAMQPAPPVTTQPGPSAPPPAVPVPVLTGGNTASIIANAMTWLGVRYLWGGCTVHGIDCSCFVRNVLRAVGIEAPRTTITQIAWTRPVSLDQAQPTDLLYFNNTCSDCGANPTHVGMYLGNGQMIHAGDPVHIESIDTTYWRSHFNSAGRIPV